MKSYHIKKLKSVSDEDLVVRALKEVDIFGTLVSRYEKPLLAYIQRISMVSQEQAEDALQESFLNAWKNLNDFDPSLNFSTWIYRITHNQVISEFRKSKSRKEDEPVKLELNLFEETSQDLDFVTNLDKKLEANQIQRILKFMTPVYREALVLHYFENQSYKEIADILRKPTGTIPTLLRRAKKEFKKIIKRKKIAID